MIDRPTRLIATGSQTVGPFFHLGLTADARLGVLAHPGTPGERLRLRVRVTDGRDAPVSDCLVELWQADADGRYVDGAGVRSSDPRDERQSTGFTGFGRLPTNDDGTCEFETIRPGRVPDGSGGWQASHIALRLFMRGLLRHIDTRVYFAGDPAIAEDAVLALVPEARRATLLAHAALGPDTWAFDVRLQGPRETVFLDV